MLDLLGAKETVVVEGRFARPLSFVTCLASLRPDDSIFVDTSECDLVVGALRLAAPELSRPRMLKQIGTRSIQLDAYRGEWRKNISQL